MKTDIVYSIKFSLSEEESDRSNPYNEKTRELQRRLIQICTYDIEPSPSREKIRSIHLMFTLTEKTQEEINSIVGEGIDLVKRFINGEEEYIPF